jgi:hypothetical protein
MHSVAFTRLISGCVPFTTLDEAVRSGARLRPRGSLRTMTLCRTWRSGHHASSEHADCTGQAGAALLASRPSCRCSTASRNVGPRCTRVPFGILGGARPAVFMLQAHAECRSSGRSRGAVTRIEQWRSHAIGQPMRPFLGAIDPAGARNKMLRRAVGLYSLSRTEIGPGLRISARVRRRTLGHRL